MSKKAHVKKQKYKAACRELVRNGRINNDQGVFVPASQIDKRCENMVRDMVNGYRFNR